MDTDNEEESIPEFFCLIVSENVVFSDDALKRCAVAKGDLPMCGSRSYYGRTAIWDYGYDFF